MATTPTVYVICDQNCKFEGMTKEQILTAIMQAVESGEIKNVDAGFITTIKTINGKPLKFFVGPQAEYDALTKDVKNNLFAIITNDTTKEGLLAAVKELQEGLEELEQWKAEVMAGRISVRSAEAASEAELALTINGLAIQRDANGLLKIDNIIIPQKKLLFSGEKKISNSPTVIYEDSGGVGDRCYEAIIGGSAFKFYIKIYEILGGIVCFPLSFSSASIANHINLYFKVNADDLTKLYCNVLYSSVAADNSDLANHTNITALYEVIE